MFCSTASRPPASVLRHFNMEEEEEEEEEDEEIEFVLDGLDDDDDVSSMSV